MDPPPDEEPIDWLLLTNVAVTNLAEAGERMAWYSCRWVVEMFHKVLKSGCRVEERQFGEVETLRRYLILDSIVAWRVLDLTLLGRQTPQLPCTVLLENDEWQALYCYHHHTTQLPDQIPSLQEAVRWIAQLGGFLGRKADKQPGTMTVWRGLQRLNDIAATWLLFHPSPDISV